MKNNDLMVIAVAALGLFLVAQQAGKKPTPTQTPTTAKNSGGQPGFGNLITTWNGWRYYDSGYVTDQFGSIYYQGEKVADSTWGAV